MFLKDKLALVHKEVLNISLEKAVADVLGLALAGGVAFWQWRSRTRTREE